MTEKDKQLLIKDLCARLPYGVICHYNTVNNYGSMSIAIANAKDKLRGIIPLYDGHIGFMVGISKVDALEGDIRPYLRPMSSMTEEEVKELVSLGKTSFCTLEPGSFREIANPEQNDWLNAHHFDYRGLIPMGLALEAPEGMYKTK